MTWGKVTQTLTGLSFELLVIALIQGVFVSRDKSYTVELLQTTAFIFLLVATFLAVLMYFGKLKDSKPTMITTIVFCFLSGKKKAVMSAYALQGKCDISGMNIT